MSSYCKDTLSAEVVVSDVCNDIDRVAVFRSSPSSLEACPLSRQTTGLRKQTTISVSIRPCKLWSPVKLTLLIQSHGTFLPSSFGCSD
jgi:hypothetical protein